MGIEAKGRVPVRLHPRSAADPLSLAGPGTHLNLKIQEQERGGAGRTGIQGAGLEGFGQRCRRPTTCRSQQPRPAGAGGSIGRVSLGPTPVPLSAPVVWILGVGRSWPGTCLGHRAELCCSRQRQGPGAPGGRASRLELSVEPENGRPASRRDETLPALQGPGAHAAQPGGNSFTPDSGGRRS